MECRASKWKPGRGLVKRDRRLASFRPAVSYARIAKLKVHRQPKRLLSDPGLSAIWCTSNPSTPRGQRDRTLLLILRDTSVRISELCGIRLGDVDLAAGTILIHGKGGHTRNVGMSPRTVSQLTMYARRWRQPADLPELLHHAVKWSPIAHPGIREILLPWSTEAGLPPFSPNAFRRTSASSGDGAGADGLTVAAHLGHASLTMTKH